jgi:hypothetical protein
MDDKFKKNLEILEENDVYLCSTPVWKEKPNSVELETYTNAGEDMIICLEEPTKAELLSYVDGFDIDEQVMLWWSNGADAAHAKGVPFDNIREHYEDYEAYLAELRRVAELLD